MMNNYYLAHHGIVGMKWGKRNGPPYPLSDAKHDKVVNRASKGSKKVSGKVSGSDEVVTFSKPTQSSSKKSLVNKDTSDTARKAAQSTRQLLVDVDRLKKKKKDYKEEYEKLSDAELKKIVTRDTLEQKYNDMRNRQETDEGRKILASNILATSVLVADLAMTAASTVWLIKQIKSA